MNANSINKIRSSLHHQANLKHSKSGWHKENTTELRMQEDEKCVQNLDIFSYHFEFCHVTMPTTIILSSRTISHQRNSFLDLKNVYFDTKHETELCIIHVK